MAVAVTHTTVAAGPNDPSKQVSSDAWNATHTITGLATVASTGAFGDLTGTPTTLAGYGVTDAYTKAQSDANYQPIDSDLTAIAGLSATGLAAQTAVGTWANRTITGTVSRVSVSNGNGVSGNPTVDIDAAYAGQNTIATVGTVTSGVWNAGAVTSSGAVQAGTQLKISTDAILERDAANVFAMRNGVSAQNFRIYNTFTDASNYERLTVGFTTDFKFNVEAAGTGTVRNIIFAANGSDHWQMIGSGGTLRPGTDNSKDLGATTLRIRNLYVGTAIVGSGSITTTSATSGIGYATGAGGTVTQATSKATGVTLSKNCGQITMNAAALAAGTIVSFVVTNTSVAATDLIHVQHQSGGTLGAYSINASSAAGSFTVQVRNNTTGSLSEAIVIAFAVIKGVTA